MNLVRFEPWSISDLLHRDLDRFAPRRGAAGDVDKRRTNWVPAVDIVEQKDRFILHADVPGVDPANIEVQMDDGVLSVSGERQVESRDETDGVRRFERVSGRFDRRFALPETADAEGITAKSSSGILEVVIPKLPEVEARRITVAAA